MKTLVIYYSKHEHKKQILSDNSMSKYDVIWVKTTDETPRIEVLP